MKARATLGRAFRSDAWGTAAVLIMLLCACVALVSAEWVSAAFYLSLSAFFVGASRQVKTALKAEESSKWDLRALLAGGIGLLGVASAHVIGGDAKNAVLSGLVGAIALVGAGVDWRRTNVGRLSSGRH
jgi:hypothetical protein